VDSLARAIVTAARAGDDASLRRYALSAREFIDLVYPASPFAAPPAREAPGRVWMTIQNPSASGRNRLVGRLRGRALSYEGVACGAAPERQGANTIWTRCRVTLASARGQRASFELFGSIIERGGRFKVVSYRNQF
jgi:hypothetical protein